MAHKVMMELPARELNRADAVFRVHQDGKRLGTLHVSNGSMVWFPRSTRYGYKISWAKFDDLMHNEASRFEKR